MEHQEHAQVATRKSYIVGFVLSLILTLTAYFAVTNEVFAKEQIPYFICSLGLVQAVVQLIFFLHLGSGSHPRWNVVIFLFMFAVLLIVVVGSLWIMAHLNYNMMPSVDNLNLQMQRSL